MSKKVVFTIFILVISLCVVASATPVKAEKKGKPIVIGAPVPRASAYVKHDSNAA